MELEILRKVGLAEGETKVYRALLELGISSLNNIQERTGIERRNIYDILNKLIDKGLVSYEIEKGRKTFQITHPNKLLSYLEEKKNQLDSVKEELKKELPPFLEKYKKHKPQIKSEIYRGLEGFKAIGDDMLNYKNVWIMGGSGEVERYIPSFWKFYNKKRIKKKVMWHDLIEKNTLMTTFKNKNKKELKRKEYYEFRVLPEEFRSPNIVCIYGYKVANMLWSEGFFAFVMQNKAIADAYLDYFKFLWRNVKG